MQNSKDFYLRFGCRKERSDIDGLFYWLFVGDERILPPEFRDLDVVRSKRTTDDFWPYSFQTIAWREEETSARNCGFKNCVDYSFVKPEFINGIHSYSFLEKRMQNAWKLSYDAIKLIQVPEGRIFGQFLFPNDDYVDFAKQGFRGYYSSRAVADYAGRYFDLGLTAVHSFNANMFTDYHVTPEDHLVCPTCSRPLLICPNCKIPLRKSDECVSCDRVRLITGEPIEEYQEKYLILHDYYRSVLSGQKWFGEDIIDSRIVSVKVIRWLQSREIYPWIAVSCPFRPHDPRWEGFKNPWIAELEKFRL